MKMRRCSFHPKKPAVAMCPECGQRCAYQCSPCRWEPGPWHDRGCPSWRPEIAPVPAALAYTAAQMREAFVAGARWHMSGGRCNNGAEIAEALRRWPEPPEQARVAEPGAGGKRG